MSQRMKRSRVVRCKYGSKSDRGDDWFEIRLFYVRVAPCVIESVPDHFTLRHLQCKIRVSLEINRTRVSVSDSTSLMLRRNWDDKESSEVMYVSIDSVRVTSGVEFEVYENNDMVMCRFLEWWKVFGSMEM
ncbi:C-terminal binding protein AN-like [Pyrus ussuriensis x Pyrus communis]|uniref:C-terminal binding protein AN-like n=1 Tax=Pyrus ussuriensis x Pyrus communis TaxID=2448454 RepID=A0A5N5H5D5_9ROSA|nr:C-terminal binding protein AN-like [Pyrus ussuriensis x Pyrus communis]